MKLLTYINYDGHCREAFRFYERQSRRKITMMMTHGEGPNPSDGPPNWKDAILHERMQIGETELLGGRGGTHRTVCLFRAGTGHGVITAASRGKPRGPAD
jgi:uncharacterized glyoxalase superfamily protein PhnB